MGNGTGDDAAVYKISDETALVLTVDFFPPIVDDPWHFGAIAAANSFSDVYAMGGKPILALNLACFPVDLPSEILVEILKGAASKAQEAGVMIVGGHTVNDEEPKYGMAVTGVLQPGRQVTNASAKPGDKLILTKPLGTGIITTAGKNKVVDDVVLNRAIEVMSSLNKGASEIMMEVGANACTDITGFGLLGHLQSMAEGSGVTARIHFSRVPLIGGTWDLAKDGVAPGGTHRNMDSAMKVSKVDSAISEHAVIILCDAQTSGGLLISVSADKADTLLSGLHGIGLEDSAIVGEMIQAGECSMEILP